MQFIERRAKSQTIPGYRLGESLKVEVIKAIYRTQAASWNCQAGSHLFEWPSERFFVSVIDTAPILLECRDPVWPRKIEGLWRTFNAVTTNIFVAAAAPVAVPTLPVESHVDDLILGEYLAAVMTYEPSVDAPSAADIDQDSGFVFPDY